MVLCLFILIMVLLLPRLRNHAGTLSVHDLDWDDYITMNHHVSSMVFHIPPHFMNDYIDTQLDLTGIFRLFSQNRELLTDQATNRGRTVESDFEVVLEFNQLSGEERFLNNLWYDETLKISFFVERSLAQISLDLRSEAVRNNSYLQNPGWRKERIPVREIDWLELINNYTIQVESVFITRLNWPTNQESSEFISGEDDLGAMFSFLYDNLGHLIDGLFDADGWLSHFHETGELESLTDYDIQIFFRQSSMDESRQSVRFHMSQELGEQLFEIIGEELWNLRRRDGNQD